MNIFTNYLQKITNLVKNNQKELQIKDLDNLKGITVENPPPEFDFDLSCNISLIISKNNKLNPRKTADNIKKLILANFNEVKNVDIAGPGFINIKLNSTEIKKFIKKIFDNKKTFGCTKKSKYFNIEYVSANPTGPMHVGHCRGAIYGDVLANLLEFNGNKVIREYYINDYGNQIRNFVKSVFLRIREIKYKEKFLNEENLYPGAYVIDIAQKIINEIDNTFDNFNKSYEVLKERSLKYSMELIKSDLNELGIIHNNFISETDLVNKNLIVKTVDFLKQKKIVEEGYLDPPKGENLNDWKKTKKLIFKSTKFGDDSDRALQKNDGTWTYFANDVAYHMDKVSRKYDHLINVLGADHTGYIKRITSAVSALSGDKVKLDCRVCQLVKLYKNGQPFKMSKRAGDFISLKDLLSEVDKDSIRFMMLNRSNDIELDFDFDKVLEKSKDNPVFYVQYCYARISSLFRNINKDIEEPVELVADNLNINEYESKILRKIFDWPKVVETASSKYEPHRIPFYLYELATLFHSYWSKGNEDSNFRFLENEKIKSQSTLAIIQLVSIVITNGMKILGVSLPKKM
jgi:arginyl-tRNA synthetase